LRVVGQIDHAGPKVVFLGDINVGKTSIIRSKRDKSFDIYVLPTAGIGTALIDVDLYGRTVELRIWDTARQEGYQALVPLYLRRSAVAVLVCSIFDPATVTRLQQFWISRVEEVNPGAALVAVVNKIDLAEDVEARMAVQAELCRTFKKVFLVSAKTGFGIEDLFQEIARLTIQTEMPPAGVAIDAPVQRRRDCC
jgi:small GTP-binding protein